MRFLIRAAAALALAALLAACRSEAAHPLDRIRRMGCPSVAELEAVDREQFVEIFQRESGEGCVSHTIHTIEGDPTTLYLLVEDGCALLVVDNREDRFYGEGPRVIVRKVTGLAFGQWDPAAGELVPAGRGSRHREGLVPGVIAYRLAGDRQFRPLNGVFR